MTESRTEIMMFKAILWDNDGVLVDTELLYFRATAHVLHQVGVHLTEDLFHEFFLKESRGAWHLARKKGISSAGIEALRAERNDLYRRMLNGKNLALDAVAEVLKELRPLFGMAIVTSSWKADFELIHRSTGLLNFFDFVLTREDYTLSKPDPEPYLMALQKLGLPTQEALVIEDSERGLIAAKRAGLPCWVIPNNLTRRGDFSLADRVLRNIEEAASMLLEGARKSHLMEEESGRCGRQKQPGRRE